MTTSEQKHRTAPVESAHGELKVVHGRARCHRCGSTAVIAVCSSCSRLLCGLHDRTASLTDPWRKRTEDPDDAASAVPPSPSSSNGAAASTDDEAGADGGVADDGASASDATTDGREKAPPTGTTVPPADPAPPRTTPKRILERHFCADCLPPARPHDLVVQTAAAEIALGALAAIANPWIGSVLATVGAGRIGWRVVASRRHWRTTSRTATLFLDPRITELELTETLSGEMRRRDGRCTASVTKVTGEVRMEAVWSRAHTAMVVEHRRKRSLSPSDELSFSAGSLVVTGPGRFALPLPRSDGRSTPMLVPLRSFTSDHPILADAAGRGDPRWVHTTAYTVDATPPEAPAPVWVTAALAPGSAGRALELDVQWCFADPVNGVAKREEAPRAGRIDELRLSVPAAWGEVENISGADYHTTSNVVAGRREISWQRAKVEADHRGRHHLSVSFQRPLLEEPDVPPLVDGMLQMTFRKAVSGATGVQVHAAGGARRQDGACRKCRVRTRIELGLDLDLTGLRYQAVRTVPDPLRDGGTPRQEFRRYRGVTPNHETVALLTDMLSDQGYYVKAVVENPTQTGAGGRRRRVWDINGRRYNGVHPINFHIGLTGNEVEKDNKASGRRSSTRVRLNVSGTYANDEMEHDIVTEQAQLWDRIQATLATSPAERSGAAPSEPIDAASTEVVRMRHAVLTLRARLQQARGSGEPADRLVADLLGFLDEEFGVAEPGS